MRAPEQIGAFLPGPISAAMADKSLTDTDKADLISVLNKATGDYLSGADTESLLELNTALSRFGAKSTNKQFQQFIKEKVENNVATSQKGNKSSKFGEHVKKEQDINANLGKRPEDKIWTETSKKESVKNAYDHWDKHKHEFPEFQNSKQYVDATHNFVRNPPEGTLTKVRENGDTLYYNPSTNIFAIKNADGTPRQCLNQIQQIMDIRLIWSILMHKNNEAYICRVCGLEQSEPQWGEDGQSPTYNICECCGVEFGYEDATLMGIKKYRDKWIQSGAKWNCQKSKPIDWSIDAQLLNIPKKYL